VVVTLVQGKLAVEQVLSRERGSEAGMSPRKWNSKGKGNNETTGARRARREGEGNEG
jgi:hypothetical protein